ncbi:MAG: ShlB/FhaC/HecB family hemolysin secretion/activation protein [Chthoniobacterales bacterium]
MSFSFSVIASSPDLSAQSAELPLPASEQIGPLYIQEYRVTGADKLPAVEVEEAVYPYMGPGRSEVDVENARAALESAYHEKGFQSVAVEVPEQTARGGVIVLNVVEAPVGRLRVRGSRFYDIDEIKRRVPSLAEGNVPNFNDVAREIVEVNQLADRRVAPSLNAGFEPGTVDVELTVEDTFPLHGSLELNNRYIANTTPLRLNGTISYGNLWQLGHTIGFSFQIAPEELDDAQVYSLYYIARAPQIPWLSAMFTATRQNSNISTLGGSAVAGNGEIIGGRLMATLPSRYDGFYHSLSFGLDYKHLEQDLQFTDQLIATPITYYPFTLSYNAAKATELSITELNAGVTWAFSGAGSDAREFDNRRFNSDGSFLYLRGDLAHTQDLPYGFQLYGQAQGQTSGQALVDSEQFAIGGLDTVRGYLEAEALGDNAFVSTIEARSPALSDFYGIDEWRIYAFWDYGLTTLNDPLPQQTSRFELASIGAGSRLQLFDYLYGSVDAGLPLISQSNTAEGDWRVTFRLWGEF